MHCKYYGTFHQEYIILGASWKEITSVRLWSNQSVTLYKAKGNTVSERKESGICVTEREDVHHCYQEI